MPCYMRADESHVIEDAKKKTKSALLRSLETLAHHPVFATKVVGGSWCFLYGCRRMIGGFPYVTPSRLVDLAIGLPMGALGIFLLGNAIENVHERNGTQN